MNQIAGNSPGQYVKLLDIIAAEERERVLRQIQVNPGVRGVLLYLGAHALALSLNNSLLPLYSVN